MRTTDLLKFPNVPTCSKRFSLPGSVDWRSGTDQ